MTKVNIFVVSIIMVLISYNTYSQEIIKLESKYTKERIELDGEFKEGCWKEAIKRGIENIQIMSCWNDDKLYIGVESREEGELVSNTRNNDDKEIFNDDYIGISMKEEDKWYQIVINPAGAIYDIKKDKEGKEKDITWTSNAKVGSKIIKDTWNLELSIPFRKRTKEVKIWLDRKYAKKLERKQILINIELIKIESEKTKLKELIGKNIKKIMESLKSKNPKVRADAAYALGYLGDPSFIPLLQKLASDKDFEVRLKAIHALGQLNHPSAIPTLQEAMNDSDPVVSSTAVLVLGDINDPSVVPILEEVVKDADSPINVRATAIQKLGELKDLSIVPTLQEIVKDPNSESPVRMNAIMVLGELKDLSSIDVLQEALKDPDPSFRIEAASALAKLKDQSGIPTLQEELKNESPDVRKEAVSALVELKDPSCERALQEALKDSTPDIRIKAAYGLVQLNNPLGAQVLQDALNDSDTTVRMNAVDVLTQLKDPSSISALQKALKKESNPDVRKKIVFALAQLNDSSIIPSLQELLNDNDLPTRLHAASALAKFNDPSLIPISLLQELLGSENISIKLEALKIIEKLYGEKEIRNIIKEIIEVGKVPTEYDFGWELKDINEGIEVIKVKPGSLSDKAGIKEKDIIVKIEEKDIKSAKELLREIKKYNIGSKIRLEIIRERNKIEKILILER